MLTSANRLEVSTSRKSGTCGNSIAVVLVKIFQNCLRMPRHSKVIIRCTDPDNRFKTIGPDGGITYGSRGTS